VARLWEGHLAQGTRGRLCRTVHRRYCFWWLLPGARCPFAAPMTTPLLSASSTMRGAPRRAGLGARRQRPRVGACQRCAGVGVAPRGQGAGRGAEQEGAAQPGHRRGSAVGLSDDMDPEGSWQWQEAYAEVTYEPSETPPPSLTWAAREAGPAGTETGAGGRGRGSVSCHLTAPFSRSRGGEQQVPGHRRSASSALDLEHSLGQEQEVPKGSTRSRSPTENRQHSTVQNSSLRDSLGEAPGAAPELEAGSRRGRGARGGAPPVLRQAPGPLKGPQAVLVLFLRLGPLTWETRT